MNSEIQSEDSTKEIGRYRIKKGQPLMLGGRQFITINALAGIFDLDRTTIQSVAEKNGLSYALGITRGGNVYYLYDPEEIRPFLRPYLELPKESKRRVLTVGRKTYRTINSFVRLFGGEEISYDKIQAVIVERNIPAVSGIDRVGHIADFYNVRRVRESLSDFLSLPIEGGRFKTRRALAKTLGVDAEKIGSVVGGDQVKTKRGKNPHDGTEEVFYNAGTVRNRLSSYLALPQADEEGVIETEDRKFVLQTALARTLETTRYRIKTAIEKMGIKPEKGKDHLGREHDFYDVEEVRNAL